MPGSGRDAWFQGVPGPYLVPGGSAPGGVWYPTCTEADPPPGQTATAADGMHPIGMYSCFDAVFMK